MGFGFVTADRLPNDRLSYWQQLIAQCFGQIACRPVKISDFNGQIFSNDLRSAQIITVMSGPASYHQAKSYESPLRRDGDFYIHVSIGGPTVFEKSGQSFTLKRGDLIMLDRLESFSMNFAGPAHFVQLRLSRSTLCEHLEEPGDYAWKILDGVHGIGAILRAVLSEAAALENITETEQAQVFHTAVSLLVPCLKQRRGDRLIMLRSDRLDKAKRYMVKHIDDPDLNAERVADAVGISLRTLYRLFAEEGTTLMRWLMIQRVEASYRALADGLCRDVTDAALSHGFKDLSHFSRSFRKRFSRSPRSVLRSHAARIDPYTLSFIRNAKAFER